MEKFLSFRFSFLNGGTGKRKEEQYIKRACQCAYVVPGFWGVSFPLPLRQTNSLGTGLFTTRSREEDDQEMEGVKNGEHAGVTQAIKPTPSLFVICLFITVVRSQQTMWGSFALLFHTRPFFFFFLEID